MKYPKITLELGGLINADCENKQSYTNLACFQIIDVDLK